MALADALAALDDEHWRFIVRNMVRLYRASAKLPERADWDQLRRAVNAKRLMLKRKHAAELIARRQDKRRTYLAGYMRQYRAGQRSGSPPNIL